MISDPDSQAREPNVDTKVVEAFGEEWGHFTQAKLPEQDRHATFEQYFSLFPWERLSPNAVGADIGCGSGRWGMEVAPRVGELHCVDPSDAALAVARANLGTFENVSFHLAHAGALPFQDSYLDFAYSLGVLHHVPDTAGALKCIAAKLKPGAPLLIYLYYAFDNRPFWYRMLWRFADVARRFICKMPFALRFVISQIIAASVYWPLARTAYLLAQVDLLPAHWPLAYYRNRSFYVMRTDALDRFGTRIEHRFTRVQIEGMLEGAGFSGIRFSDTHPYWCAIGFLRA